VKFTSPTKDLIDMDDGSSSSRGPSDASAFNPLGGSSGHDHLRRVLRNSDAFKKIEIKGENTTQRAKDNLKRESLARQSTRNWKPGDIYAPHDLSPQEMVKWKAPKQPTKDIIDMLGLNPLDHYRVSRFPVWVVRLAYRSWVSHAQRWIPGQNGLARTD
jgi:hypothetical protein